MLVYYRLPVGFIVYRVERTRRAALSPRLVIRARRRWPVRVDLPPGMAWHEVDAIQERWESVLARSRHWLEPWFSQG